MTSTKDLWRTPARRAGRLLARVLIRGFPRRFGLFEMFALGSIEWMRRHLAVINELERFRAGRSGISVLDFGGADGALGRALDLYGLAQHYSVTVADVDVADGHIRPPIRASVAVDPDGGLPFPGDSFDVVASSDVFEHIPAGVRPHWAAELARVSRGPQIHTMPCDSADGLYQSTGADARFDAWYAARYGERERWTAEHLATGVPQVDEMQALLGAERVKPIVNANVWLATMTAQYGQRWPHTRLAFALRYLRAYRSTESRPPFKSAVFVTRIR